MDVFEAVADPVRRRILRMLQAGDTPAGLVAAAFTVSRPAVSRHLRVLREAGLVEARVEGQQRVYRLRAEPLAGVEAWAAGFRAAGPGDVGADRDKDEDSDGTALPGPAGRLDALGTEVRRGRRARAGQTGGADDGTRPGRTEHDDEGSHDEQHHAAG